MKKDNAQAIYNIIAQIILNGTNFVLIMIFTRFLTTAEYGTVSIFQAYSMIFSVIVGLNVQGSIGTAFVHIDKKERNNYMASIMLLAIVFFLVILLLTIINIEPISEFSELSPKIIIVMLMYSFGIFCFNFANIKYVYLRKSQFSCLMAFIVAGAMIGLSWCGIRLQSILGIEPYVLRILSISIPYIICAFFVLISIFLHGNPLVNIKKYLSFCIPICLPLVFHGISQIVLGQTDKIMLQKFLSDNSIVGIYSFIVTFVHILNAIYTALNNTWVPIYYENTKKNMTDEIYKRANRYSTLFVCLCMGFMMVAPEFVKLFAHKNYWSGIKLIPLIVLSVYFTFLYSFAVNYELYHRKSKWIAIGTSGAAVINIVFNALLIPRLGMVGAAVATLISYIALFMFHQFCAFRIKTNTKYPFSMSFFIRKIIPIIILSIVFVIIQNMGIIRWGIACLIGAFLVRKVYKNKTIF